MYKGRCSQNFRNGLFWALSIAFIKLFPHSAQIQVFFLFQSVDYTLPQALPVKILFAFPTPSSEPGTVWGSEQGVFSPTCICAIGFSSTLVIVCVRSARVHAGVVGAPDLTLLITSYLPLPGAWEWGGERKVGAAGVNALSSLCSAQSERTQAKGIITFTAGGWGGTRGSMAYSHLPWPWKH